jgi:hypothetical protein
MATTISRQPSHASSTTPWWASSNLSRASRTRRIAGTSEIFYPSYHFFRFSPFSSTNPATTHDARASSVPVGFRLRRAVVAPSAPNASEVVDTGTAETIFADLRSVEGRQKSAGIPTVSGSSALSSPILTAGHSAVPVQPAGVISSTTRSWVSMSGDHSGCTRSGTTMWARRRARVRTTYSSRDSIG